MYIEPATLSLEHHLLSQLPAHTLLTPMYMCI